MKDTMSALVYERYGDPKDVLEQRVIEVPSVGDDEVLVKVHAAAVNPLDWHLMVGKPALARLSFGMWRPTRSIPGNDIAGTVEAVGSQVTRFQPGDEVFGECFGGGLAEYVAVAEDGLVQKPGHVTFEDAAAIPVAALTALQGLRDWGGMNSGDDILVIGASGGVGTYAVQIAKALGAAHVTGVASTRNVDTARELGADLVIDYTREDYAESGRAYDVIFDVPGNRRLLVYRRLLEPDGIYVLIGGPKGDWITPLPLVAKIQLARRLGIMKTGNGVAARVRSDLELLRDWLAGGHIRPIIDRNYKLSEGADALDYQGTFHARGKIVVTI